MTTPPMQPQARARMRRYVDSIWAHRVAMLLLLLAVVVPLNIVGELAAGVTEGGLPWDEPVLRFMRELHTGWLDAVMIAATEVGRLPVLAGASLVIAGLFIARGHWGRGIFVLLANLGAVTINLSAKAFFARDRPQLWEPLRPETTYSFPSGHAMESMAFALALLFVAWHTRWRWAALAFAIAFPLLVGTSRLYLGVHYPSDVLAGWLASIAWVAGLHLFVTGGMRLRQPRQPAVDAAAGGAAVATQRRNLR